MNDEIVCQIRCPIHGFIPLNAWEKTLIETPVFQRLRRIRQLAWTDYVYPGAMHTRFEHSLGVMHVATLLFDSIARKAGGPNEILAAREAGAAFRAAMPQLAGFDGIRDFIACIAYGVLIDAIPQERAGQLLYAAQVALTLLPRTPRF